MIYSIKHTDGGINMIKTYKDLSIYTYKKRKWHFQGILNSIDEVELYNLANYLNDTDTVNHFFFPLEINPRSYPEILEMEKIVKKNADIYLNDFYIKCIRQYFQSDRKGVFLIGKSGINYIPLNKSFNKEILDVYSFYLKDSSKHFFIHEGNVFKANNINLDGLVNLAKRFENE